MARAVTTGHAAPLRLRLFGFVLAALLPLAGACRDIQVEALFTGRAVLTVDGERCMLRVGESGAGVRLLAADSRLAVLEVDGERLEMGVSQHIGTAYREPARRELRIQRDDRLQYRTTARINGHSLPVLVDTGANVVALNVAHARDLGIDYQRGVPVPVETASGRVRGWGVRLDSVDVGGIRVTGVQAAVIEGDFPATVLLGMSYLQHVDIREDSGVLRLSRDW